MRRPAVIASWSAKCEVRAPLSEEKPVACLVIG